MAIPLNTTHISIQRVVPDPSVDGQADLYDSEPVAPQVIRRRVRAVISVPSGSSRLVGGDRVAFSATLTCDPCDLQGEDVVTDDSGNAWTVLWAEEIKALGLHHMNAALRRTTGASA